MIEAWIDPQAARELAGIMAGNIRLVVRGEFGGGRLGAPVPGDPTWP